MDELDRIFCVINTLHLTAEPW